MKPVCFLLSLSATLGLATAGDEIFPNRAPLQSTPFISLDLGSIRARGWLENQLQLQADGLTGHAEAVIPELGPDSGWRGGDGESWEKGPYYLRGLVSLAYVKDDADLKKKAQVWIDALLDSQRDDGQLGPASSNDWWPRMVMTWVLRDYFEATGDPRVIPALTKYARYMHAQLPKQPLHEWARARSGDQIDTLFWLYNRTGDAFLLELVDMLSGQTNSWKNFYRTLEGSEGDFRIVHGVNVSQGMKYPVVNWERTGDADDRKVFADAWDTLRNKHGLSFGMWSGTEPLAGKSTTQGVEMCSIVEQMLSSEVALGALGDPVIGDQLEKIAFNLLPGGTTKDFKQFQYYTLPNAPVAKRNNRGVLPFRDDHGDDLLVSPHSGFHCCCYNLHMGWPKYVQHSWMATSDGGLAAVAYGPTEVSAKINGTSVTVTEETDYPFNDVIRFQIESEKDVAFPFKLRIPGWAVKPQVTVNGKLVDGVTPGNFLTIDRTWKSSDTVTATFPAELGTTNGFNGSASIWRGPLVFSLRIGEKTKTVTPIDGGFDEMEFTATTPWNYALDMDRDQAGQKVKMQRSEMPKNPWLPATTPITLTVPAKKLPAWGLTRDDRMAEEVPASPVKSDQPTEQITLVPFGAQTLRITAFPLLRGSPILEAGITASHQHDSLESILTNPQPKSSKGEGMGRFTFWDHLGTSEWIEWTFDKPEQLSSTSLYWFDDSGSGRCKVPASWRILYKNESGEWLPVKNTTSYTVEKDQSNEVNFETITTQALRVEVQLQDDSSAGVLRWSKK